MILFSLVLFSACAGPATVSGNYLRHDASRSVIIRTDDGRSITMRSGEYIVHEYQDSAVVNGSGTVCTRGSVVEKEFHGSIDLRDITEVQIDEPASAWFSLPVAGLALSLFVIVVYLASVHVST